MPNWSTLSLGQKNFYMEFYAPIIHNVRQIPHNNEFIPPSRCTPSEIQINSVTNTGDRLVRSLNYVLSETQRNVILECINQVP